MTHECQLHKENQNQLKCAEMTCKRTDVHLYDAFYLMYELAKEMYFLTCKRSKTYCQKQKLKVAKPAAVLLFFMQVKTAALPHKCNQDVTKTKSSFSHRRMTKLSVQTVVREQLSRHQTFHKANAQKA